MTKKEAKLVLSALCKKEKERFDPGVTEALRMAENDPELADWFADLLEFDTVISDELEKVPVPVELEQTILSEVSHHQPSSIRQLPRRSILMPLAAAATLAAGIALWLNRKDETPSEGTVVDFQRDMLRQIERLRGIDHRSTEPRNVEAYLTSRNMTLDFDIPATIGGRVLLGCTILKWNGHPVTLVCFTHPEDRKKTIHLFSIAGSALIPMDESEEVTVTRNGWNSAVFETDGRVQMIAARGISSDSIKRLAPFG